MDTYSLAGWFISIYVTANPQNVAEYLNNEYKFLLLTFFGLLSFFFSFYSLRLG